MQICDHGRQKTNRHLMTNMYTHITRKDRQDKESWQATAHDNQSIKQLQNKNCIKISNNSQGTLHKILYCYEIM